jgi:hypothetical protein
MTSSPDPKVIAVTAIAVADRPPTGQATTSPSQRELVASSLLLRPDPAAARPDR